MDQNEWKRLLQAEIPRLWRGVYPTGTDLEDSLRLAVTFQERLGVEAIILPSPLTTDPGSDYNLEADWLRRGVQVARAIAPALPAFATVAISDRAVRGEGPWTHELLGIVLDQVTAQEVEGVYLVLEQANEDGYYVTHPNTLGALLRLSYGFASTGRRVISNFAGTAGLVLLAAGAEGWSSGWYRSERRLRVQDFERDEDEVKLVVPAFYSHPLAGEVHMKADFDRIAQAGYLARLADSTPASRGLLEALGNGGSVGAVPEWVHSPSNRRAAIEHFLYAVARETMALGALSSDSAREAAVHEWLRAAVVLAHELYKLGGFNKRTAVNHQEGWLAAYESYLRHR
jgi:hypothetical protein